MTALLDDHGLPPGAVSATSPIVTEPLQRLPLLEKIGVLPNQHQLCLVRLF